MLATKTSPLASPCLLLFLLKLLHNVAGDVLLSGDIDGLVEGDSFTLECSSNNQGDTLLLFRNGSPIENGGHFAVESTTHEGAPVLSVTVTDAEMADGGSYTCRSNEDYFDEDTLQVNILAGTTEPEIDIVDPEADSLMVEIGATLNMKCIGGRGSRPVWQHNGFDLTGQTPGGRVLITDSVDVNTGNKVSLLSREEMTLKDAGQYSCQDKNAYSNHDEVVVSVEGASEQAAVEIFEPTESKLRLLPAHMLTLKCQSGKSVDLKWSKDGDAIEADEIEGFIINVSVDEEKGVKTSMLSKQQASTTDSGVYFCSSLDDSSSDKVSVLVADEAAESNALHSGAMPVKETRVLLRVGSPITLRCHLAVGAGDVPQAEWTKGSQLLRSGPKYIISSQHGSMPSTLLISDPVRDDVGRYHCIFRHRDSGTTACIFIFHVYTIPCPSLFPPDHGAKLQCPHNPVYGESCTFSCRAGRRLSHSRPLVCEKFDGGGDTYWSDAVPKCHRISAEEDALLQENEVPFSMSHVLLRVGSTQTLQCNHPGTWTKDNGIVISGSGNKYTVEHSSLIIHNTQKGDSGLYECHIRHPSAAGLMGIKKYNVTTISCPRTLTPKNGVSTGCTSQPVYGETCRFRCNRGFRLTGSRSRTCDLADSQMHVYWTGNTPMCKGPRFPQKNSALAGEGGHSEQAADHSLLSSIPSCHEATSRRGFLILLILLPSLFCVSCLST